MDSCFLQGQRQNWPATLGHPVKLALIALHQAHSHSACSHTGPLLVLTLDQKRSCLRAFALAVPLFLEGSLLELPLPGYFLFTHISIQMSLSHSPLLIPCQKRPTLESPWPAPFLLMGSLCSPLDCRFCECRGAYHMVYYYTAGPQRCSVSKEFILQFSLGRCKGLS